MAKVKLNPSVASLHGKIGQLVYRELYGQTVVAPMPDFSKRALSDKQVAVNKNLCAAALYGKKVLADPEAKAAYAVWAKELNIPLNAAIYKDWCHGPTVEAIDLTHYTGQAAQTITVRAIESFRVAQVFVTIRAPGGQVLETGPATQRDQRGAEWFYCTSLTAENVAGLVVEAVAFDGPGNQNRRIEMLPWK